MLMAEISDEFLNLFNLSYISLFSIFFWEGGYFVINCKIKRLGLRRRWNWGIFKKMEQKIVILAFVSMIPYLYRFINMSVQ